VTDIFFIVFRTTIIETKFFIIREKDKFF